MDRYGDEIAYDGSDGKREHKCLTIRTMDRNVDKESSSVHIVKNGETLFSIARDYYGDFRKWYMIADKNPSITNPLALDNGAELIIPDLETEWGAEENDE